MSAYPKHTPVLLLYYVSLMTLPLREPVILYPAEERHKHRTEDHNTCEDEYQYPHPHFLFRLIHAYHLVMTFFSSVSAIWDIVAEDVGFLFLSVVGAPPVAASALVCGQPVRALF